MVSLKYFRFLFVFVALHLVGNIFAAEQTEIPVKSNREALKEIPLPPELEVPVNKEAEHPDRFFSEFISMLFTLGIIVLALLLLSWLVKRVMNSRIQEINESSSIKILDKRTISPRTVIYVLDINGKTVSLAESHTDLIKLGEGPEILSDNEV